MGRLLRATSAGAIRRSDRPGRWCRSSGNWQPVGEVGKHAYWFWATAEDLAKVEPVESDGTEGGDDDPLIKTVDVAGRVVDRCCNYNLNEAMATSVTRSQSDRPVPSPVRALAKRRHSSKRRTSSPPLPSSVNGPRDQGLRLLGTNLSAGAS